MQSDWKFEGKMARKQYYTTEEVLQEMAMDSDSDMEPAHDEILLDSDDLAESSNEAVLNEPVPCLQVMVWEAEGMNMTWKTFVYKIPPWSLFFSFSFFCYLHNSTFNYTKTNLRAYTIQMQKFHHNLFRNKHTMLFCDYPICFQTLLGSLRPAPHQLSGKAVQHGSKTNVTNISRAVTFFIHEHVYISTDIHWFQRITQSIHSTHFCCCCQNQSNRRAFTNTVSLKAGETTMQHSGKSSSEYAAQQNSTIIIIPKGRKGPRFVFTYSREKKAKKKSRKLPV